MTLIVSGSGRLFCINKRFVVILISPLSPIPLVTEDKALPSNIFISSVSTIKFPPVPKPVIPTVTRLASSNIISGAISLISPPSIGFVLTSIILD